MPEDDTIHALRLANPRGVSLIKEREERKDKQVQGNQIHDGTNAVTAEGFAEEISSARWDVHKLVSAKPEHKRSERHQDARYAKRPRRTKMWIGEQPRREQHRECGPKIN